MKRDTENAVFPLGRYPKVTRPFPPPGSWVRNDEKVFHGDPDLVLRRVVRYHETEVDIENLNADGSPRDYLQTVDLDFFVETYSVVRLSDEDDPNWR